MTRTRRTPKRMRRFGATARVIHILNSHPDRKMSDDYDSGFDNQLPDFFFASGADQ